MRIYDLTLETNDLGPPYEFYVGDLALPVVRRSPDMLALQIGATKLQFRRGPNRPFYHFAINVHPARFERARATLAAVTQLLHDSDGQEVFDFRSWTARACYCNDPSGNIVELIARNDLSSRPVPAGPGWISVSEIGLVTGDVPAFTSRLTRELGLAVYRESAGETFAALGDAEGLFILAQTGRVWYPETGKVSAPTPVTCEVEINGARWRVHGPPYQFSPITPAAT